MDTQTKLEHTYPKIATAKIAPVALDLQQNSSSSITANPNSTVANSLDNKAKPRYLGPYEVDRRTKGGSYVLKELDGTFIRQSLAAFRLYPYIDRKSELLETLSPRDDEFIDTDSSEDDENWDA